jgi:hypothetical protein
MRDTSNTGQVNASCPTCGAKSVEVLVTVDSGLWERQFLQCRACRQALVTEWSNTHLRQPVAPLVTCSL